MIVCWSLLGVAIFAFLISSIVVENRDNVILRLGDAAALRAEIRNPYAVAYELHYWETISGERVRFLEAKQSGLENDDSFEILVRGHSIYSETPTMSLAQARDRHAQTQAWVNKLHLIEQRYGWGMVLGNVALAFGLFILVWNVMCHAAYWLYGFSRSPE